MRYELCFRELKFWQTDQLVKPLFKSLYAAFSTLLRIVDAKNFWIGVAEIASSAASAVAAHFFPHCY
jgi:hypothetical protein